MSLATGIKEILEKRRPNCLNMEDTLYAHASVLVPIFEEKGVYKILFTKRSTKVGNHSGQMSFPGGVAEESDRSWVETALREAREEIGLSEQDVKILGRIDDAKTVSSRFIIHPCVGQIPFPYDFNLNPAEVKSLVALPLKPLMGNGLMNRAGKIEMNGRQYRTTVIEYHGEIIWGATARITENLVEIVKAKLDLPDGME
jgi:8-oxo-dGTP pyrophosphatase MutT (NUDIX family)